MIKLRNITNKLVNINIPFAEYNFGPLRRILILIVQTDLNIHICFVMRDTNAYGVPGSRGKVPKTPG